MRIFCLRIVLALAAMTPTLTASSPVPSTPLTANPESNPYLRAGMDAIASGLKMVTVAVDVDAEATLARRINQVHFGISLTGWTFVAHEVVSRPDRPSILLLTYRH